MTIPDAPLVRMSGISKRFPNGVTALDGAELTLHAGEIHAVVGENGAGKSTLMTILYGMQAPSEGEISVAGAPVTLSSPLDANEHGIGMVHQEFHLFGSLSVAENIVFGAEPRRSRILVDRRAARARAADLAGRYGLTVDPARKVAGLSIGERQRVEILKALHRDARVLILDEPTAVLTPQEVDSLFAMLRGLRDEGVAVVVVTHKLREVMDFSDRVTVLRDGETVSSSRTTSTSSTELASQMTGRSMDLTEVHIAGDPTDVVLSVQDMSCSSSSGRDLAEVSFSVRAGEIVGIAGVSGSGQADLLRALAGLVPVRRGTITLCGTDVTAHSAGERRKAGLAYVPEDRREVGAAVTASIEDNFAVGYHRSRLAARGLLSGRKKREHAKQLVTDYAVRTNEVTVEAGTLSGGNLQKVIVGREMGHAAPLLIVDQPTRGVDIGAIENIHARIREYRNAGHAVLVSSAELSEIRALSDRVLVMYDGKIVAQLDHDDADERTLGLAMTGLGDSTDEGASA